MAFTLTPMTELDAVNMMLISIGQTPVNTLEVSGIRDVAIAKTVLQNTAREILGRGWAFNRETNYELVPDISGHIVVPAQAFHLDPVNTTHQFVIRSNAGVLNLYDLTKKTFVIDINPLRVNVVWFYGFDEIPQYARNYIAVSAARRFQAYMVGSQVLFQYTSQDEQAGLTEMQRNDLNVLDINILSDGDWTNQIFLRRRNP